jgi:hypothetical protein
MTNSSRRGRPVGATHYREHDERLLEQAARRLFFGLSRNATAAFSSLLEPRYDRSTDEGDRAFQAVLRRLQRQWKFNSERYMDEARRGVFAERWKFEAKELRKGSPKLSRTIDVFASSPAGRAVLLEYGSNGIPAEPLSLGLMRLWEEIVRHSAIGPIRAEELFDQAYTGWSSTGLEPDEAFLRRFAELCLMQADRLAAQAGDRGDEPETGERQIATEAKAEGDDGR